MWYDGVDASGGPKNLLTPVPEKSILNPPLYFKNPLKWSMWQLGQDLFLMIFAIFFAKFGKNRQKFHLATMGFSIKIDQGGSFL